MTQQPAGWYPDSQMANTQRYWDGARWTEQVAPAVPTDAAERTAEATSGLLNVVLIVVALGIAVFAMWAVGNLL